MVTTLLAIVLVSAVTCIGSLYARRYGSPEGLIALYVLFVTLSQIIASKIALFDIGVATFTAPAAVVIFAVTFLITDIVNERFGRSTTYRMIAIAFATQIVMLAFLALSNSLEPAPFWDGQDAWKRVFGIVPRIMLASWATFLVSENLDAFLFDILRRMTGGRHLWMRNVVSSALSLSVDTVLFVSLAFAGTDMPLWELMKGQFIAKYLVCLADIPFMYLNRWALGVGRGNGLEGQHR